MGKQSEAVQLGYTAGTIENAAYALLSERGAAGMTVDAIVAAAPKRGYVFCVFTKMYVVLHVARLFFSTRLALSPKP